MIGRRTFLAAAGGGVSAGVTGCVGREFDRAGDRPSAGWDAVVHLAATTSAYDTGLVPAVNQGFEEAYGVRVRGMASGTGGALRAGRVGDADLVLVHARRLEDEFIRAGYGINRRDLMRNDYVLVGPAGDPAGVRGAGSVTGAFGRVYDEEAEFFSRGDVSGTHVRELDIWEALGREPAGGWYLATGQGMGPTLVVADQRDAYTFTDRATFQSMADRLDLVVLVAPADVDDPEVLANPYGLIAANPAVTEGVAYELAMLYIGFATGPVGQRIIREFTLNGEPVFEPIGLSAAANFHQYVPADVLPADATEAGNHSLVGGGGPG